MQTINYLDRMVRYRCVVSKGDDDRGRDLPNGNRVSQLRAKCKSVCEWNEGLEWWLKGEPNGNLLPEPLLTVDRTRCLATISLLPKRGHGRVCCQVRSVHSTIHYARSSSSSSPIHLAPVLVPSQQAADIRSTCDSLFFSCSVVYCSSDLPLASNPQDASPAGNVILHHPYSRKLCSATISVHPLTKLEYDLALTNTTSKEYQFHYLLNLPRSLYLSHL